MADLIDNIFGTINKGLDTFAKIAVTGTAEAVEKPYQTDVQPLVKTPANPALAVKPSDPMTKTILPGGLTVEQAVIYGAVVLFGLIYVGKKVL